MDKAPSLGFNSYESERCLRIVSYDGQELAEDALSKNMALCVGDDEKLAEQSSETLPQTVNDSEPCTGMEFRSRDDAREFYVAYGRRMGFTVRIHHNRRSRINNLVIGQDFVCSKEGFREKKYAYRKDRVLPPPPVTREGCSAMMRVAMRDGAKWVVTKFVKEHSHKLMSPSKVPWRGSGKNMISEDEKDQRIRQLTLELHNERQRCKRLCAAYQEQLRSVLKDVEEHTDRLSERVRDAVQRIKQLEDERPWDRPNHRDC